MKKTVKTVIATFLALIIACGSLTAFASTPADIEWSFDPDFDSMVYSYAGELEVDAETAYVSPKEDSSNVYCTFEAAEDGYYMISSTYYSSEWFGIPEKYENGVYCGVKDCKSSGEYLSQQTYYLEAGEYVIGFDFFERGPEEVSIDFLGDIVNIAVDEEALSKLIYDVSFYENIVDELDGKYWAETSVTIEFENGTDISEEYSALLVFTDEKITKGEYEVELGVFCYPYRQKATINVIDIRDLVAKIELENLEGFTNIFYDYNYEYYNTTLGDEDLTVTYTDGTTETLEDFSGFDFLEVGAWVEAYYDYDDEGNYCFIVEIAGVEYINETCTEEEASFLTNSAVYHTTNYISLANAFFWMRIYFGDIFSAGSITESFGLISRFFTESASEWLYAFAEITENTARLFDYMF